MTVGERIRKIRRQNGLAQVELAARAGCGLSTLQRIESGKHIPNTARLQAIAAALGVPVVVLQMQDCYEAFSLGRTNGLTISTGVIASLSYRNSDAGILVSCQNYPLEELLVVLTDKVNRSKEKPQE